MDDFMLLDNSLAFIMMSVFLLAFSEWKYNRFGTYVLMAITITGLILLELCGSMIPDEIEGLYWKIQILQIIYFQSAAFVISEYRDERALFTGLSANIYAMLGTLIGQRLFQLTGHMIFSAGCAMIVSVAFLLALFRWVRPGYMRIMKVNREGWRVACLIPWLLYCCVYNIDYLMIECSPKMALYITVTVMLTIYTTYALIIWVIIERASHLSVVKHQEIQMAGIHELNREIAEVQRVEQQMAIQAHDWKHKIRIIQSLIADGNYEAAMSALERVTGEIPVRNIAYCANVPINAVLNSYVNRAKEKQIYVTVRTDALDKLGVDEWETAVVIGNLLENAVRCCSRLEQPEDRKISVVASRARSQVMIEICNTFEGEIIFDTETGLPVRTGGSGHGIGMKSITDFCEKYDATFDCGMNGKMYYARLLI